MSHTFIPPTTKWATPTGNRLLDRLQIDRGIAVVKEGGVWVQRTYPTLIELDGLVEGTDFFLGGHVYTVDDTTYNSLVAAGLA